MSTSQKFQRQGSHAPLLALIMFGALLTGVVLLSEQYGGMNPDDFAAQVFSSSSSPDFGDGVCGDGILQQPNSDLIYEQCDDGNLIGGDGCAENCLLERCGDTIVDPNGIDNIAGNADDEECDDGNSNQNDSCTNDCKNRSFCGDGTVDVGEACDDGNTLAGDGCNALCELEFCGDGVNQPGEDCDDFNSSQTDLCSNTCTATRCGDGFIQNPNGFEGYHETCDDGNTVSGDGCSAVCTIEGALCGDGALDAGEECDDGNTQDGDGCSAACMTEPGNLCPNGLSCTDLTNCLSQGGTCSRLPQGTCGLGCCCILGGSTCGDGTVDSGEECDDGNTQSGDGCSSICAVESVVCEINSDCSNGECCDQIDHVCSASACTSQCPGNLICTSVAGCAVEGGSCSQTPGLCSAGCCCDVGIGGLCGNDQINAGETCVSCPADVKCSIGTQCCSDGTCQASCSSGGLCGDGNIDPGEACDDGNTQSGDGCSAACTSEAGCCGNPSLCTGGTQCNAQSCTCEEVSCIVNSDCSGQNTCCLGQQCVQAECGDGLVQCNEQCEPSFVQKLCVRGDGAVLIGCDDPSHIGDACGTGPCIDSDGDGRYNCEGGVGTSCSSNNDCIGSCRAVTNDPCCSSGCQNTGAGQCTADCGNGRIDIGEECDDGNALDSDTCTSACFLTSCGDGVRQIPNGQGNQEECDDGNTQDGDGCSAACSIEGSSTCGDGIHDFGEGCDDGNLDETDTCTSQCWPTACGDGTVQAPNGVDQIEECDDGNFTPTDSCKSCSFARCGDRSIYAGVEECDDGDTRDGDGCSATCMIEGSGSCGDGIVDWLSGEQCEQTSDCALGQDCSLCRCIGNANLCGNGQVEQGETCLNCAVDVICGSGTQCCSDGTCKASCGVSTCNNNGTCDINETCTCDDCAGKQDGCELGFVCDSVTDSCAEKICGNQTIEPREHCDTSFPPSDQGPSWQCSATCDPVFTCGNGIVELGEQCETGSQNCLQNCAIDQCAILRASQSTGFMEQHFNLPSWRYGMDAPSINGPEDPTFDPYLWWNDAYLREVTKIGSQINKPAPYLGPNNQFTGDVSHHSAKWFGTVTVPLDGFYAYTWLTRDDAWIMIDGIIADSARGIQSAVSVRNGSIFLREGTHNVEVYFVSRQAAQGQEGVFFFGFNNANLSIAPYLPGCSYCGNGIRESGELCDDGFRNGQGNGICNASCSGYGSAICGNGTQELGEECDDGNTGNGDGCSNVCSREAICGNNAVEQGEECDDGNILPFDGCTETCTLETVCGNGTREGAETCDDGNTDAGDGCGTFCQVELILCGNAVIDTGEQCDSGGLCIGGTLDGTNCRTLAEATSCKSDGGDCLAQDSDPDGCDSDCMIEVPLVCGNGIRQGNEECDEGICPDSPLDAICNDDARADRCRSNCALPRCGDAVTDSGEQCDTGDDRSDILPDLCRLNCELPRCGDDVVDLGEQCDDGILNHDLLPNRCRSTCENPRCGDNVSDTEFGETCDDGNLVSGDGCSALCEQEPSVCGNNVREVDEECDDGNLVSGDGCSSACDAEVIVSCGDSAVQTANGEECDDGNTVDADACDTNCQLTICGDAVVQPINGLGGTEQCDDGNAVATDSCTNTCQSARCGDQIILAGTEECDDGNQIENDLCTNTCIVSRCGDGVVQSPNSFGIVELCDDGNANDTDACTNLCRTAFCGDGIHFAAIEQCDDGNRVDHDGCSALCVTEAASAPLCGNGILEASEQCDDLNLLAGDGCSPLCQIENAAGLCGNGAIDGSEECDDQNIVSNDGCSATCTQESGGGGGGGGPSPTQCGNSFIERGEQCDDGNRTANDGCSSSCLNEIPLTCGNGTVESPEECDQGAFNSSTASDACRMSCNDPYCGDGVKDTRANEECDDGNTLPGDGCSSICRNEVVTVGCGNGNVDSGEQCDAGSNNSDSRSDACRTDCRLPLCGDRVLDRGRGEECDDGNSINNDGCSASCHTELATAHPVSGDTDPMPVHPAPEYVSPVTYEDPQHAITASLLSSKASASEKTPETGPGGIIIVIALSGMAASAFRKRMKMKNVSWPLDW